MIGVGKKEAFQFDKLPPYTGKRESFVKIISLYVYYVVTECGTLCTYSAFMILYLN